MLSRSALLASAASAAADFSVGLGGGIDRGKVDCVASFPCDHSSAYAKFYGGYQVTEAIDVQLVYFDAGRLKGGATTTLGTQFGGRCTGIGKRSCRGVVCPVKNSAPQRTSTYISIRCQTQCHTRY